MAALLRLMLSKQDNIMKLKDGYVANATADEYYLAWHKVKPLLAVYSKRTQTGQVVRSVECGGIVYMNVVDTDLYYKCTQETFDKWFEPNIQVEPKKPDPVNHPKHYTGHPSGVECIQVTEHMNFCRGNAMKYLWRAREKENEIEDLKKAVWYIQREIQRLEKVELEK